MSGGPIHFGSVVGRLHFETWRYVVVSEHDGQWWSLAIPPARSLTLARCAELTGHRVCASGVLVLREARPTVDLHDVGDVKAAPRLAVVR